MVNTPVVTTLATDEPEIMPVIPDETTAALAGPPRNLPSSEKATWMKKLPAPAFSSSAPNRTNRKMNWVDTPSATPNTPSDVIQKCDAARPTDDPLCESRPGRWGPR